MPTTLHLSGSQPDKKTRNVFKLDSDRSAADRSGSQLKTVCRLALNVEHGVRHVSENITSHPCLRMADLFLT